MEMRYQLRHSPVLNKPLIGYTERFVIANRCVVQLNPQAVRRVGIPVTLSHLDTRKWLYPNALDHFIIQDSPRIPTKRGLTGINGDLRRFTGIRVN